MMTTNVITLAEYRDAKQAEEPPRDVPLDLAAMSYDDALDWAGADFNRLLAVARARDYRPEWIVYRLESDFGVELQACEAEAIAVMVAEAGPYMSRRQRWILRQLRIKPLAETALTKLAAKALAYRDYKHPDRCVRHDIAKLTERGLVQARGGKIHQTGGSAPPARIHHCE
jgi:hypothetical protein